MLVAGAEEVGVAVLLPGVVVAGVAVLVTLDCGKVVGVSVLATGVVVAGAVVIYPARVNNMIPFVVDPIAKLGVPTMGTTPALGANGIGVE